MIKIFSKSKPDFVACLQMVVTVFQIVLKWQALCSSGFGVKSNAHLCWPRPALSQQGREGVAGSGL